MSDMSIVEKAIKDAVDEYAKQLQEDLMEQYSKEFERRLESKRIEIASNVIGMISVHEDLGKMQIIVNMK